jgi:hypothetical protein
MSSHHDLRVVVQPAGEVRPQHGFPIAVRLRAGDDPSLFAYASLINPDGSDITAPVSASFVRDSGNIVESAHTLVAAEDDDDEPAGADSPSDVDADVDAGAYVLFPSLRIREPGTYRVRVTLVRMDAATGAAEAAPLMGAAGLTRIDSAIIRVHEDAPEEEPMGEAETRFLRRLRS